jgi:hypothetical protein
MIIAARASRLVLALAILCPLVAWSQAPSKPPAKPKLPAAEKPNEPAERNREAVRQQTSLVDDVMPLINKLGCNNAACHAAARGQGNLRLSMFGDDPAADFDAIVRASPGRRISPMEPAKSLLLEKATGGLNHGGKKRMEAGSPEFATLLAWISEGAAFVDPHRPKIVSVRVTPEEVLLEKGQTAPLKALAVLADGSQKDVTAMAALRSSDPKIVSIDATCNAKAEETGQAAIVANYLHHPGVARIVVPQKLATPFPQVAPNNKIDELVLANLKRLGIPPSDLCSDEVFLRRVYLDVIGVLPTPDEVRAFAQDKAADRRSKLIDRLLDREEFADCWAMKWSELLRIKSEFPVFLWPKAAHAYHRWVRQSILENKPYDQFVRELLIASGSNFRRGEVNFFRANQPAAGTNPDPAKPIVRDPQTMAETTAMVFMGVRMGCARCHGHPAEHWSLDDNLGLAAFFSKVAMKQTKEWKEEIVYVNRRGYLGHPKTYEVVKPKYLDGEVVEVGEQEDPRRKFADWLIRPENPYFTKNIVNRVWSWLLGRGIIHEPDDLRASNPPSNPELLAFLEKDLIEHKYDLKHLFRLILNSKTYQLSSRTTDGNKADVVHFSHFFARRLDADILLDAIGQVTETSDTFMSKIPEPYTYMPEGTHAVQIYDGNIEVPFQELFGRPPRDTPYECERSRGNSVLQHAHLINSEHVRTRLSTSPRIQRWVKDKTPDEQLVDELFMLALCRPPQAEERKSVSEFLAKNAKQREQAVQDVVWSVLNVKEFLLNH